MDPVQTIGSVQESLKLSCAQLAALIGVDTRTVFRWRDGEASPRGAGWTILLALRRKLEADPATAPMLRVLAMSALGYEDPLGHLMARLLSSVQVQSPG